MFEEDIAKSMEFGSPTAMYQSIRHDGYPICPMCGLTDVAKDHCEEPPGKPRQKARRGGGEAVDLPPAKEATEQFLNALERLELDINRLGLRKERYRDGRFEAEDVHPSAARTFCRDIDANSDEEWEDLCTEHGVDPSQESFIVSGHGFALAEGASQHPAEPLPS